MPVLFATASVTDNLIRWSESLIGESDRLPGAVALLWEHLNVPNFAYQTSIRRIQFARRNISEDLLALHLQRD